MEPLVGFLESDCCGNLLLALAHTLWQGALAACVLCLYLRRTPAQAVGRRYIASVATLGAIVLCTLLTWSILSYEPAPAQSDLAASAAAVDGSVIFDPIPPGHPTSTPDVGTTARFSRSRQTWLMGTWLAGVGAMLLRMAAVVAGGNRLRIQCRPLENAETLNIIEQLRIGMGIDRRIRALVSERISTPGVIGCLWPALLLPASMLSGIPADDLRAILVHELAHIRRYDYLINFLQMVVEALFFFNPAVWWISKQIRIEREACCDAAGVQWIGQRAKYAEALVAWAHRLGTPAPAVGFSNDTDRGTLLDRIRRILIAGHQPHPRVSWRAATAMVVLSLVCVTLLGQATGLAVNLAGRILSHQERIDRIVDISKTYGRDNDRHGPDDEIQVSGTVRTCDGAPLPESAHVLFRCERSRRLRSALAIVSREGTFSKRVEYGPVYVSAWAEGYAPVFTGPLETQPGGRIEGVDLILSKGYSGRIRITDETGHPLRDAKLTGGHEYPERTWRHTIELTTDANGIAALEHVAARKIILDITADGFEPRQVRDLVLTPGGTTSVTLRRTQPAKGVVLAEATGLPIEGAEIRVLASGEDAAPWLPRNLVQGPDAVTDAQGRFQLNRLRRNYRHLLVVRATGFSSHYVPDVRATDNDITVSLGPAKAIHGRLTGDLSLLARDERTGAPLLFVENAYRLGRMMYSHGGDKKPVTIRDGVGYFEIDDFWGQEVRLSAGSESARLDVEKDRLDDVVIDLRPVERREVVLWFQVPPGAPPVEGGVSVGCLGDRAQQQKQFIKWERLDIRDGRARCQMPVPGILRYRVDFYQDQRPVGYWFGETEPIHVEPGEEPYVVEVPTLPAGAVYGTILRSDGSIPERADAFLDVVATPEIGGKQAIPSFNLSNALGNRVDRGTFNATPLPLGGRYAVVAHEGNLFAVSETLSLDERNPLVNVNLQLPKGVDIRGRLLDSDGAAARNTVVLGIAIPLTDRDHPWRTTVRAQPDEAGCFVFENVGAGPRGTCAIEVDAEGYKPVRQTLTELGSPVVIRLVKDRRIAGTIVDEMGLPASGVEVCAIPVDGPQGGYGRDAKWFEADGRTDAEGRFTFSGVADGYYRLDVSNATLADRRQPIVGVGQEEPAAIRIVIHRKRE